MASASDVAGDTDAAPCSNCSSVSVGYVCRSDSFEKSAAQRCRGIWVAYVLGVLRVQVVQVVRVMEVVYVRRV